MTYSFAVIFAHGERPEEDSRLALELANKAVALDDEFAQAHSALGLAYTVTGHHDEAIDCVRRAIELQPGDADAQLFCSFSHMFAGQMRDAYDAINTALRLDPQYVKGPYLNILGIICFFMGNYEEAMDAFKRNVERGGPLAQPALAFRAAACGASGFVEDAKESAEALLNFFPAFSSSRFPILRIFKRPEDRERAIEGLRKAGLPD